MNTLTHWPENIEFTEGGFAGYAGFADKDETKIAFPLERMPNQIRYAVKDCMRVVGVEPDLPCIMALSAVSAAIGSGLKLYANGFQVRGNIYGLGSAPSGVGKSTCYRPIMEPLQDIEAQLVTAHDAIIPRLEAEKDLLEAEAAKLKRSRGDLSDNAQRLAEIKTRLTELEKECRPPQLIAENVTIEALAVLLEHNNEAMAMLSPDASEVITNWLGRYNKTDRTDEGVLLKAWTGEPCRINRLSRKPVSLREPCLALLLCCTPDEIRNLFANERFVLGGLLPRFLVCESHSRPREWKDGESRGWDGSSWSGWKHLIRQLYRAFHLPEHGGSISASREAQAVFNEAHNAYCRSFDVRPEGDSFEARRVEHAMRIALCLHAAQHSDLCCGRELSKETAETAILLAAYFGQTASRIQSAAREQRDEEAFQRIEETMAKHGVESEAGLVISIRELTRRNGLNREQLEALARRHPGRMEILTLSPGKAGGRASEVVCLKGQIL